jgi:hypothetical protein
MSFFRKLGRVFRKGASEAGHLFKKGASEVKGAITRGAHSIGSGLGGMGGVAIGTELGGPVGGLIGGVIGSQLGGRTAQQLGKLTAPHRNITTKPIMPPPNMSGRLGANGHGQYRGNGLEKQKPKPNTVNIA